MVDQPIDFTKRCCGNSPGKSHTNAHDDDDADYVEVKRVSVDLATKSPAFSPQKTLFSSPSKADSKKVKELTPNKQSAAKTENKRTPNLQQ